MLKRIISFMLKLGVTAGLFVLLFWPEKLGLSPTAFHGVKPHDLLNELRAVDAQNVILWLALAAIARLIGMFCGILRWRLLLRGQKLQMPIGYLTQSWFIGRAIGMYLPGTIGLDGYRLYDSARYTGDAVKCTTVIAIEKLTGFISLTFLVFLTFPLGMRLTTMKIPVLAAILAVLGAFVAVSFVMLLNPRVLGVLVAVVPTPKRVRNIVNRLGASVTAYSGSRAELILAVFLGVLVHFATCIVFFCTMTAIRAHNTGILDILFVAPLMTYATVIGPSVGGEGIREIVFASFLAVKSGAAASILLAHLGWWAGDVVPWAIGSLVYLFAPRPSREDIAKRLAENPKSDNTGIHLMPEQIATYRTQLLTCLLAGILAGLIAGSLIGLGEAHWLAQRLAGLTETRMYIWGAAVYGVLFAGVGFGIACGLAFLGLIRDRLPRAGLSFGLALGGTLTVGLFVIGRFRIFRDLLGEHAMTQSQTLKLLGAACAVGLLAALLGFAVGSMFNRRKVVGILAGLACYGALIGVGIHLSGKVRITKTHPKVTTAKPNGPNIILVAVDTLRADFLKAYSPKAPTNTPTIDALCADSVLFTKSFAQASWTKASFATIFSGLYPETHTAIHKDSMLPSAVTTFPEVLQAAGYYTKGFANNPNIAAAYNYGQGFDDYTYLKPRLLLGATESVDKLSLYQVVRKVYQRFYDWETKGRINVEDFYMPAPVVTQKGIEWLDSSERPKDTPFFLFLHYMDPHDPYIDHEHPGVGYARARMENPDIKYKGLFRKLYAGEIDYFDKSFAELIAALKKRNLYEDSVIVFLADHGEEFHEHGGWWHGLSLYDEQVAVPLIIKLPKNQLAGKMNINLAPLMDVAPTILQLAGLKKDPAMQGNALFAPDLGKYMNFDVEYVYSHLDFEGIILRSARTKDEKLIESNPDNKRHYAPVELYDLKTDPGEQTNLAGKGNEKETTLTDVIAQMRKFVEGAAVAPEINQSDELYRQLKSLGYIP